MNILLCWFLNNPDPGVYWPFLIRGILSTWRLQSPQRGRIWTQLIKPQITLYTFHHRGAVFIKKTDQSNPALIPTSPFYYFSWKHPLKTNFLSEVSDANKFLFIFTRYTDLPLLSKSIETTSNTNESAIEHDFLRIPFSLLALVWTNVQYINLCTMSQEKTESLTFIYIKNLSNNWPWEHNWLIQINYYLPLAIG